MSSNKVEMAKGVTGYNRDRSLNGFRSPEVSNRALQGPEAGPRKRRKAENEDEIASDAGGGRRRGEFREDEQRRVSVIVDAAKIDGDSADALPQLLAVVTSAQAAGLLKCLLKEPHLRYVLHQLLRHINKKKILRAHVPFDVPAAAAWVGRRLGLESCGGVEEDGLGRIDGMGFSHLVQETKFWRLEALRHRRVDLTWEQRLRSGPRVWLCRTVTDLVRHCAPTARMTGEQGNPPSPFVVEVMAQVIRLLPRALDSAHGAATFIECLGPFESLEEYVLPASLYRAIALATEPRPVAPGGDTWKRRKEQPLSDGGMAAALSYQVTPVTGLQTLREYLCMNGKDAVECASRTVVATLIRALLGAWEGSVDMGRALFDQSVLKNPNRSVPVGLGLEMLVQSLVQDNFDCNGMGKNLAVVSGKGSSASAGEVEDSDKTCSLPSGYPGHRRCNSGHDPTAAVRFASSEVSAYVTIVGNYVRADADTARSFFQDIIPALMALGVGSGGRDERGWKREGDWGRSKRLPSRLSAVLRSLVDSTRSRNFFNVETMVVHTVRDVKDWGDPADILSSSSCIFDAHASYAPEHCTPDGKGAGSTNVGKAAAVGNKEVRASIKQRRRGMALACLDILGPTRSCTALIRREMVEGESKANLRSAVAEALLEYRRTCAAADVEAIQILSVDILSDLGEDSVIGVRLSALTAVGEAFPTDSVPAASFLLRRCLDTSPKVRRLAVRLLVDEFRLGDGSVGASLARAVLSPPPSPRARFAQGEEQRALLGSLLQHRQVLEETDGERFPALLRGLVKAVLQGEDRAGLDLMESSPLTGGDEDAPPLPTESSEVDGVGIVDGDRVGGKRESTISRKGVSCDRLFDAKVEEGSDLSWEALATPAARLCAACWPFDPAQLDVVDMIVGDIYHHR